MLLKHRLFILGFLILLITAPIAYQIDRTAMSLPKLAGESPLPGLIQTVTIEFDAFGIPSITAQSKKDAYRTLGYLHARDRLFQMDLLRRHSSGRLAEIMGQKAIDQDIRQRGYGFSAVAEASINQLPESQRSVLLGYAEGVNEAIRVLPELPPEFRMLHYRPEPWRPADSLLVALSLFQLLSDQEQDERMLTIMSATLPPEVVAFLTPDTDEYSHPLIGGPESRRPPQPIPVAALAPLMSDTSAPLARVEADPLTLGSNNWAVNGSRTVDGRAMIANDMHLPLGVPNVWYRATLNHPDHTITGLTLPGVPLVVVGSTPDIAWGFTNVDGDLLDLVSLQINPDNPAEYLTPTGWRPFDIRRETIAIRDEAPLIIEIKNTLWGPVSPTPLMGKPVAIRWTALDPAAINLRLLDMDSVETIEQAMTVMNGAGTPPQNVVLADKTGHIGWTLTGFFPQRTGLDGSISQSWANGLTGWNGFLNPDQLPRLLDPKEGFIATANNRTLGKAYPHIIGHGFSNSYRAYRINQQLAAKPTLTERDMLDIQLDTTSEFYEFYRRIGLEVLERQAEVRSPEKSAVENALRQWNGRLDPDSRGIALIVRWRNELASALFAPLTRRCALKNPGFSYRWREQETPLRALLTQRIRDTLPGPEYRDWDDLLLKTLERAALSLRQEHDMADISLIDWKKANTVKIHHPFSRAMPLLGNLLDMPEIAGGCNAFCVKVLIGENGASERLAVSPNHPQDGLLQMPGGQSGHPLSPHYRDQQRAWSDGSASPFLPGVSRHRVTLIPRGD